MIWNSDFKTHTLTSGQTQLSFFKTGDVFQLTHKDLMINQFTGNPMDGSMNNIYLRVYKENKPISVPLLGVQSKSSFSAWKSPENEVKRLRWSGSAFGVDYSVYLWLATESIWFWSVETDSGEEDIDLIYTQDLGLANKHAVANNELYACQYLDNQIFENENGFVVCSRHNESATKPYLQQGLLLGKAIGYSTDALQFFGTSFKQTNFPQGLEGSLQNKNNQQEQTLIALQTEKGKGKKETIFYCIFKPAHGPVRVLEYQDELLAAKEEMRSVQPEYQWETVNTFQRAACFEGTMVSLPFTQAEIKGLYKSRKLEEYKENQLLSFFTESNVHVVLLEKEIQMERPHGHMISNFIHENTIPKAMVTSTSFMYGVFHAQLAIGNTSFNKLLSVSRGLLNFFKNSGTRIYIKLDGVFKILTLPAAYEMGMNYARWYYKLSDDVICITVFTVWNAQDIELTLVSQKNKDYEFVITNQLVVGSKEFDQPVRIERMDSLLRVRPAEGTMLERAYPDVHFDLEFEAPDLSISDDRIFYTDAQPRNGTLLTAMIGATSTLRFSVRCFIDSEHRPKKQYNFDQEVEAYQKCIQKTLGGFTLTHSSPLAEKLNAAAYWYAHNALVHYATPHGLEQTGGAAWGTRDVCQGPVEFFLATQNHQMVREILLEVFSHQFLETGDWPQWFMFDRYDMQQNGSHGDIIFWPLKAVGDYMTATGDTAFLDEIRPYRNLEQSNHKVEETLLAHIHRAFDCISNSFIAESRLISYAGGDWDDTLQPANKDLKANLSSAWTLCLAYQVLQGLVPHVAEKDKGLSEKLKQTAEGMKEDFTKHLLVDGVIPGFAYWNGERFEYLLHPRDEKTGIQYRLLPMTRSIISEMVDKPQADENLSLINQHLTFPDGVRLMNRPAAYQEGETLYFCRAEQAANVGREISLQYVHAHIRYIESLAKMGCPDKAWKAIFTILPINIQEQVPNACLRQSNTYFSSSDPNFTTRYEYQQNIEALREGKVGVRGGWRIYSSGPGIFMNQLISNILGIRILSDALLIDPVLPKEMDGLKFDFVFEQKPITFHYRIQGESSSITSVKGNGKEIPFEKQSSPYRTGFAKVSKEQIHLLYQQNSNVIIELTLN